MSIPANFTSNGNCIGYPFGPGWGGMRDFCNNYIERPDICEIKTQEDYDRYQVGCVTHWRGRFVDNNNNTVELKRSYWDEKLKQAVHFPIGSRNQYKQVYQDSFDAGYPIYYTEKNCRFLLWESPNRYMKARDLCERQVPEWANVTVPHCACLIIDENTKELFKYKCESWYGRRFAEDGNEPYKSDESSYTAICEEDYPRITTTVYNPNPSFTSYWPTQSTGWSEGESSSGVGEPSDSYAMQSTAAYYDTLAEHVPTATPYF
ncbi:hypothetical protein GGI12_004500 [Dipsacomyces acuminosporus]|nr:hypothetical protein GGI12_004500 [Dipsacomyces acuminosporus]